MSTKTSAVKPQVKRRRRVIEVRASPIHGKGVFALIAFRKDDLIGVMTGPPAKRDGRYVLWLYEEDGSCQGMRVTNALRYANHARRPNAYLEGTHLYALRTIKVDEEITWHYGDDWADTP